jgi:membrane associated rhomboid family serine protease
MLIVPVVEGLKWNRPPPVTVALILLNCLVFFLYQSGDEARAQRAADAYFGSSLPRIELPLYVEHVRATRPESAQEIERLAATAGAQGPDPLGADSTRTRASLLLWSSMTADEKFMRALRTGRVVTPEHPRHEQWKADRARVDPLERAISYRRFGFTPAEARPLTWVTSMFLHGDLMHLAGNMAFLFIVGVAVESALGGAWFILLYLLGGLAGDALHWAVHAQSLTPTVGASGAISGLMGLFTVVYGLRKVNYFYWLLVFFGFKTMRGLVMLPVWIGWEVLQYAINTDSRVAYMVHAGGLVGGALFGLAAVKRLTARRVEEFHEQREQQAFDKAEYERARALVASLDFKAASQAFARLAEHFPQELELLKQWHAVAKSDPAGEHYHRAANAILALSGPDPALRELQERIFVEYFEKAMPLPRLEPRVLAAAGLTFARAGKLALAERAAEVLLKQAPGEPRLAVLWEALAHALAQAPGNETNVGKAKRYRALISAQAKAKAAGAG